MKQYENEPDWIGKTMEVKHAMTRMPYSVSPEMSVREARRLMRAHSIRHVPVLERGELVGLLSERDILVAETFHRADYLSVRHAMTEAPYCVGPETDLSEVLETMIRDKRSCALVRSPRGIVIGIFTTHDALALLNGLMVLGSRDMPAEDGQPLALVA